MPPPEDSESLYTILNLPTTASQDEIRHKYKELAVIFHPDRLSHQDEETVQTAEQHFKDIQRAHEILTDPDLRRIYDTLGEAGLTAYRAVGQRSASPDELRAEFERLVAEARGGARRRSSSGGEFTCAFDFAPALGRDHPPGLRGLAGRMKSIKPSFLRVMHSMKMDIDNKTRASLSGALSAIPQRGGPRDYGNIVGTIKHQFSPRLHFEATTNLLRSHGVALKASYGEEESRVTLRAVYSAKTSILLPPLTLELQRKLFIDSLLEGTLRFHLGPQPSFSAAILSPLRSRGLFEWRAGLNLTRNPTLSTEVTSCPLAGGFKAGLGAELSLTGFLTTVTGHWTDGRENAVSVKVGSGGDGTFMNITLEHLEQRIIIPIVFSYEVDELIGLFSLLVPSALAVVVHNLVVMPRVRARRISKLHAARESRLDSINQDREKATKTITLLSEGAQRRAEYEQTIDGLVILTAQYITSGEDGEVPISIDVTIPIQSQVHESQLTIPGGRSKAGLLGFYDPSPGSRKRLKIEYLFHGRLHVADVGDFSQVILPLRGHLIE